MTMLARTLSLSHDGSTWVDVSAYLMDGCRWFRGQSTVLGDWQPGTIEFTLRDDSRVVDPLNDAATFQPRAGDFVKLTLGGVDAGRWKLERPNASYEIINATTIVTVSCSGADALGEFAKLTTTRFAGLLTSERVDAQVLVSTIGWTGSKSIASGARRVGDMSAAANALATMQEATLLEGGASALFMTKAGAVKWCDRYYRPTQVVTFSASDIPMTRVTMAGPSDDWFNRSTLTPATFTASLTSNTSLTIGTGSKTWTMVIVQSQPIGVGSLVTATATAGKTMTGIVTAYSYSTFSCTVNVTSTTGAGTFASWSFSITPGAGTTATDDQSVAKYLATRTEPTATLPYNCADDASKDAYLRAAGKAHPLKRLGAIGLTVSALTSGQQATVLGLEIGDAAKTILTFASGEPATFTSQQRIVGIGGTLNGTDATIDLVLGGSATVSWTPTLKQNGTVASTNSQAVYVISGGWCTAKWYVASTALGTANNAITVAASGLPTPLDSSHLAMGKAEFYDLSGTLALVTAAAFDGTAAGFSRHNTTAAIGVSPNFAVGSGDLSSGVIQYPIGQGSAFTVAFAQSGAVAATLNSATYTALNGRCRAAFRYTFTGTGTAANSITATPSGLPTQSVSDEAAGTFVYERGSTKYEGNCRFFAGTLYLAAHNTNLDLGASPSFAVAATHVIHVTLDYPIA